MREVLSCLPGAVTTPSLLVLKLVTAVHVLRSAGNICLGLLRRSLQHGAPLPGAGAAEALGGWATVLRKTKETKTA